MHRDIKPANLLLDVARNVWLTDFGLARLESEASATITGDVLGTLRYMSPEQARGDRHVVDPRSDIYGLGATLYELLTLSPLVGGNDRQDILSQIADVKPKPLRPLDGTIPVDLETIVLTAVSKDPADRYATAGAMAEDLKRFLTHQTIHARRPSLIQRLLRWSRHHRRTLALATALLVTALTVSTIVCAWAYSVAAQQREQAEWERTQAQENLSLAIEAVDQMYDDVVSQWLASDTALTSLQQQFLQRASSTYERMIQAIPADSSNRELQGKLWERIGHIQYKMGDWNKARDGYQRAVGIYEELVKAAPEEPLPRGRLARCYMSLSVMLHKLDQSSEALQAIGTSRQHLQQLAQRFPEKSSYQYDLAGNDLNHAVFLLFSMGQPVEAEQWARQAEQKLLALGPANGNSLRQSKDFDVTASMILLQVKVCLAQALRHQQRIEEGRQQCREGLGLCSYLRIDYRDHANVDVAERLFEHELAELALMSNEPEVAVSHFRRSLALQVDGLRAKVKPTQWLTKYMFAEFTRDKLSEAPTVRDEGYEEPAEFCDYVDTQIRAAEALRQAGRRHEAEQMLAEAEEISGYLADCYGDIRYRVARANSCAQLALLLDDTRPTEAKIARERAASIWRLALTETPRARDHRSCLHGVDCDYDWFVATFPECVTAGLPDSPGSDKPSRRPPMFYFHNWGIQDMEAELWEGQLVVSLRRTAANGGPGL